MEKFKKYTPKVLAAISHVVDTGEVYFAAKDANAAPEEIADAERIYRAAQREMQRVVIEHHKT